MGFTTLDVVLRLEREFGVELDISTLPRDPETDMTVEQLAEWVREHCARLCIDWPDDAISRVFRVIEDAAGIDAQSINLHDKLWADLKLD